MVLGVLLAAVPALTQAQDAEGRVWLEGIYKLDGDTLTGCYSSDLFNQERPKQFSGAEGRKQMLLTAKREHVKDK
jgi:hypothetical protein